MNESFWAESRLLAVSNGGAYKDIVQYLKDHKKRYTKYQVQTIPIVLLHLNCLQPVTIVEDITNTLEVSASDSYSFVEDLFDEVRQVISSSTYLEHVVAC